jgi:hypothetical protein
MKVDKLVTETDLIHISAHNATEKVLTQGHKLNLVAALHAKTHLKQQVEKRTRIWHTYE